MPPRKTQPATSKVVSMSPEPKPVFDPNRSYQWQESDTFQITGIQLDILNKALSAVVNDPQVRRTLMAVDAAQVIGSIIKENVENGIIKPTEENK